MRFVFLVHPSEQVRVLELRLTSKCSLFRDNPTLAASPYKVQSAVSVDDFREFVTALDSEAIKITTDNFAGLALLCAEFGYEQLGARLTQFALARAGPPGAGIRPMQVPQPLQALRPLFFAPPFTFVIGGTALHCNSATAAALSPAVALQLSVDSCAGSFVVSDYAMDPSAISAFGRLLAGNFAAGDSAADLPSLSSLFASLRNTDLERGFFGSASFELESLSLLSVDALDALLSEGSFAIDSEDSLLTSLLRLGPDYSPLLRHVKWPLVRPELVLDFAEREADVPPEAFWRVFQSSLTLLPVYALDSMIVADFPQIFSGFARKAFNLLWRGTRDGFSADIFHHYCDGHANTLTIITDTDGNIFGGFTPAKWESGTWHPIMDPSLTSFLFTLKNPHDFPAKTFALNPNGKEPAIVCDSAWGPCFGDIVVTSNCNSTIDNYTIGFGSSYVNDTGIDKSVFFSGLWHFTVKEIEVFEITERAAPDARLYIQCAELPRTVYDNV